MASSRSALKSHLPEKNLESSQKTPQAVPPFQIKVLGGDFKVTHVMVEADESAETVTALITTTSEDRWLVMAAEETTEEDSVESETQQDALALINDKLEFQIVAQGELLPE